MAAWKPDPTRDSEMVQALAAGDTRALEELYQRHGLAVLSYLIGQVGSRPLAEEVLQDVMLAVWRGAVSGREQRLYFENRKVRTVGRHLCVPPVVAIRPYQKPIERSSFFRPVRP
jgi:hypothetical protein